MNQQTKEPYPAPGDSWGLRPATRRYLLTRISVITTVITFAFMAAAFFFVPLPGSVAEAQESPGLENSTGRQAVEEALKYEGVPFFLGGPEECIPGWQMDCTCLTTTVFRKFGFELPDIPTALVYYGAPVYGPLQAGDVHVWGDPGDGTGGHVAIDLGNGYIVHANVVTMSTSVTPMYYSDPNYLGAWRLVG